MCTVLYIGLHRYYIAVSDARRCYKLIMQVPVEFYWPPSPSPHSHCKLPLSLSLTTTVLITSVMHRPITYCLVFHCLKRVFQLRMVSDTSHKKFYVIKTVFVGKKIKFVYPGLILQYPDKSWSQLMYTSGCTVLLQ